jgi:cytochrome oxidase Cu insertion factor (SCO1/SenC/PrrC family)
VAGWLIVGKGTRRPVSLLRAAGVAIALATAAALAACGTSHGGGGAAGGHSMMAAQNSAAANPDLDPGTAMSAPAPGFRLTNQFGQPISLSAFRGKVVILAFTDSECTTVCPLTTASMVAAKDLLGRAGDQVQLLGIDANPVATARSDVLAYSRSHGMVNQWDFLTGSPAQLRAVWKAYHIYVAIQKGAVDHTPALYVIDTHGRERRLYLTTMAYASITQAGQLLAQEASSLLPHHPKLRSLRSLSFVRGIGPTVRTQVPSATPGSGSGSGSVSLGPGQPRLMLFFATWLSETSALRQQLTGLNAYVKAARREKLPGLTAMDEAVTEPSPDTARTFVAQLAKSGTPLDYPVGLDTAGKIADGYGVQDQPWFVLVSPAGKILWKHDGWLPASQLEAAARHHT